MLPKRLIITSAQNPRIKSAARLQDRRERRETGLMLVEGFHELQLAWNAGLRLQTLFICPEVLRPEEGSFLTLVETTGVEVIEISPEALRKIAYREGPDAWIGVAHCPSSSLENLGQKLDQSPGRPPLLILAENLEKPGNLGAILRSADAAGADGILVCQGRTDIFNPNVVRSGKGSLFALPVVECSNQEAWTWLQARNFSVFAASPSGDREYWGTDFSGPAVIAVGAEKEGLSEFWMERAHCLVKIPMYGLVNSLNVAQAATLMMYEAIRQRKGQTKAL